MACCFSGFKQHFAQGQRYTYSLEDIGRYYRDYVELMAHFDRSCRAGSTASSTNTWSTIPKGEVRRLLEFCGLPFEAACLSFYENERAVRTASAQQVRQPIFREGMDQWRTTSLARPAADALGRCSPPIRRCRSSKYRTQWHTLGGGGRAAAKT